MSSSYVARSARQSLGRMLSSRNPLGREFRDLGEDFRAEPELTDDVLRSLLDRDILPQSIFSRDGIEQIVDEHRSRLRSHEHAIGLLISVGIAMKYLLHDDISEVPPEMHAR